MKKINKQAGFTLIELIMVIVILGVLSAFALPRFADLGGNAREASINGLAASLKSAANISHAQQLANGDAPGVTVTLEGQDITMVDGYPTADAAGINLAAQVDVTNDYTATTGAATAGADIVFSLAGGSGNCQVTYTAANSAAVSPAPIVPVVAVDVTGC
jgi:MSHA pilin protein MshA|tara:strand:+ start:6038 stop:6517 length:480 start_codon:yes stop_codon:yes gene_type:complete